MPMATHVALFRPVVERDGMLQCPGILIVPLVDVAAYLACGFTRARVAPMTPDARQDIAPEA